MTEYTSYWGLTRRYGLTEAQKASVWEKPTQDRLALEIRLDFDSYANFANAASGVTVNRFVKVPRGYQLVERELVVDEAFASSGNAELIVHLVDADDETSNAQLLLDADAAAVADLAAGVNPNSGGAFGGTVALGTLTAGDAPKVVRWTQAVAAFSAGKGVLRLVFRVPEKTVDNLGDPQPF